MVDPVDPVPRTVLIKDIFFLKKQASHNNTSNYQLSITRQKNDGKY